MEQYSAIAELFVNTNLTWQRISLTPSEALKWDWVALLSLTRCWARPDSDSYMSCRSESWQ